MVAEAMARGPNNLVSRYVLAMMLVPASPWSEAAAEDAEPPTAREMRTAGQVLGFLDTPPSGVVTLAVVFDPANPHARAEAVAIGSLLGDQMAAGVLTLRPQLVEQARLADTIGYGAIFVTDGIDPQILKAALALRHVPCLTRRLDQIEQGSCMVALRGSPSVDIVVNELNASSAGVRFATAFRMRPFALNVLRGGVLALPASRTVAAHAQTIDYDAFEQMFGEPVTSSATGKPQRVSDAPVDMVIVTADDIRRSGADTLPEVLRFAAGVDVRQYGQQDSAVGIRGYNTPLNPRVLVLLDGRQVYEDDYGFTVWPLIPGRTRRHPPDRDHQGPERGALRLQRRLRRHQHRYRRPAARQGRYRLRSGGSWSQGYAEAVATAQRPASYGVRLSAEGFRPDEFSAQETDPASRPIGDPRSGTVEIDARLQVASDTELDGRRRRPRRVCPSIRFAAHSEASPFWKPAYKNGFSRLRSSSGSRAGPWPCWSPSATW